MNDVAVVDRNSENRRIKDLPPFPSLSLNPFDDRKIMRIVEQVFYPLSLASRVSLFRYYIFSCPSSLKTRYFPRCLDRYEPY